MSESVIIGVDHGYAAMKTAHFSFHTGLVAHEHEPYTLNNVLEYGGKYYVVGSGRQPLQKDKTQTEDYYLLTLAAIAKELAYRNAGTAADIHLAAGLPLTSFGRDKKAFRDYLCRGGKPVSFRYEGEDYVITISKVSLYPQGYAAALTQGSLLDEPSVIVADIGGWTVDMMRLDNGSASAGTCRSLELGMIRCLDEAREQVLRDTGLSLTDAQIERVLSGQPCSMDEEARGVIERQGRQYTEHLLSAAMEAGFDLKALPVVILGGVKAIAKVCEKLVPFMALFYIVLAVGVVGLNLPRLPYVLESIVAGAFNPAAFTGGTIGSLFISMQKGVSRGIFSNEAGLGTGSIAHACADTKKPVKQGMFGIFEVFADTIIICTLTAMVILCSGTPVNYGTAAGAELTISGFTTTYGGWASIFTAVALCCFAFSTIIGWGLYGSRFLVFLCRSDKVAKPFFVVYSFVSILGATVDLGLLWSIADTFNGLMSIPNLIALLLLSGTVVKLTKEFFASEG